MHFLGSRFVIDQSQEKQNPEMDEKLSKGKRGADTCIVTVDDVSTFLPAPFPKFCPNFSLLFSSF